MSLSQIAEGWYNDFLNDINLLDSEVKQLGEERMSICAECPVRSNNKCDASKSHINNYGVSFTGCNCYINKKTLCKNCSCPGGFW
jgi:hypothetical protein